VIYASICVLAFLLAVAGTFAVRRYALTRKILDVPNARSSHVVATPRGGGIAIVTASCSAFVVLHLIDLLDGRLLTALLGGGLTVAIVGFLDDRKGIRPGVRLLVHVCAALWAICSLGGAPLLQVGEQTLSLANAGYLVAVLAIVWTTNLFNFMDGIDGIAASEALFIMWGSGLLLWSGSSGGVTAAALVLGSACCGFLVWNWPPAKIFMGDVGSGYLGYVTAVLAMAAAHASPIAVYVWLSLGGVFFVDATATLIRRSLNGERVHVAHRSHAYQWLARRWGNHRRVTLLTWVVNVAWLFPCGALTVAYPEHAVWIVLAALIPLTVAAIALGAGRPESTNA
jgi:Fuc2NAc and GlcNAc transferase